MWRCLTSVLANVEDLGSNRDPAKVAFHFVEVSGVLSRASGSKLHTFASYQTLASGRQAYHDEAYLIFGLQNVGIVSHNTSRSATPDAIPTCSFNRSCALPRCSGHAKEEDEMSDV